MKIGNIRAGAGRIACTLTALALTCSAMFAQTQRSTPIPSSDLGRDNLSRVAASATELKAVLLTETGLLVELKKWVAKDATDHGQIISDSDLTNDAIFERLESDSQFRSLATSIVQGYGYLLPRVNPDSELGKERELLVQERTKWLAQHQEEELAAARRRNARNSQGTRTCDSQLDPDCEASLSNSPAAPESSPGRQGPASQPSPPETTDQSSPPVFPRGEEDTLGRDRLTQAAADTSNTYPRNGVGDPSGFAQSFNALGQVGDGGASGISLRQFLATGEDEQTGFRDTSLSLVVPLQQSTRLSQQDALIDPAEMTRKRNPYTSIPSLYDMYLQAVTLPAAPRRFGSEVFVNGTRDPHLIPMDLPAGPDYVVGPGDGLSIDLWGGVSQRFFRTVDREGRVSLPEAGPVLVSGKSLAEVQQNLQQILRTQYRDVSAEVSLARLRTIRVYEVGDLANPGAYDVSSLSTPLNALFAAGGPTPKGSLRIVKHYRGDQLVQVVDLYDLLLHGVKSDMVRLDNGDTVLVPPVGPQVTVEGMVRRPAIYELNDEKNLADILELAGGLLPTAALRHIEVQRVIAHDKQTMLSLEIPEASDSAEVAKKLQSFEIRDGDRIRVFPIAPYNQDAVYLDGHVIRPGRYSYRHNMRVTDVIGSYKDLLPEPASSYAEIIRLNPPDFHPTVESFNLADALANPLQAPLLYPMDTLRIFSKFDFENPPAVSVWGDVRVPGTYRTSGQIRLGDAVHLAGGLAPDAQTDDAQVFRYLPDGKFKIFSVNLSQALA
jgi:protein involved in polysaccharide export with SLBB domain